MSRTRPCPPSTTGMMSASQAILRTVEAAIGPVNISVTALEPGSRVTGCDAGPRVGGGVHDREQWFELVGCGEDFQVLQSAVCPADEGTLALAQFLLAGFLAVLVQGVRPAFGDPNQEVLVVLDRRPGKCLLHPRGILGCGHVPDPVQGKADDGRRP